MFLSQLMDSLEITKAALREHEAVTNVDLGHLYVETFANRVSSRTQVRAMMQIWPQIFAMSDEEDRRGATSRSTARKFLAAGQFFDLLTVFEGENQEQGQKTSEKRTYAV
jgi:vacuolar protein sorting-associated protein VTA1